jgi:glycosyltransferase involved in cell wall biosynthesis
MGRTGPLEQAVALADVVLAPFLEMSSSASLSFALARGAAVVASDLRENRSLPGVRLFPAGKSPALAAEVLALDRAPEERAALRESAARYAAEHSFGRLAEEIVSLYRNLR